MIDFWTGFTATRVTINHQMPTTAPMFAPSRSSHTASAPILVASHTGAKLCPVVGYQQLGTLLLFVPKKR